MKKNEKLSYADRKAALEKEIARLDLLVDAQERLDEIIKQIEEDIDEMFNSSEQDGFEEEQYVDYEGEKVYTKINGWGRKTESELTEEDRDQYEPYYRPIYKPVRLEYDQLYEWNKKKVDSLRILLEALKGIELV